VPVSRRTCVELAAVGLVVLACAAGCGRSGGSAAKGKILFSAWVDDTPRLVALRLHGRPRDEVIPNTQVPDDYSWSPDGETIGFVHDERLYVTDEAGRTRTMVVPSVDGWAWSPDGRRIAYTYNDIGVVRADGSDRHVLVRCAPLECSRPAWSPDSKLLLYHRRSGLETVDVNGGRHVLVRCVLAGCAPPDYGRAAWSPDGKRIALAQDTRFGCGLSVVRSDGTQLHPILAPIDSPGSCGSVSWSPDGELLALDRYDPSSTAIYRADGEKWRLMRLIDGADDAAWSPDGRHLAYLDDYSLLWVAEATGARPRRFGPAYGFEWSPDGTALVANQPVQDLRVEGPAPWVIWVIDVASKRHHRVWPSLGACDNCGDPRWQPR